MITERFIRCPADERAMANGYRFNLMRAMHAVCWMETFCTLYQGEQLGSRMVFRSWSKQSDDDVPEPDWWDDPRAPDAYQFDDLLEPDGSEFAFVAELDSRLAGNETQEWCIDRITAHLDRWESELHSDSQLEEMLQLYGWETAELHHRWGRRLRRFRTASFWKAKKNKKSPVLAANSLYITMGEGEPGNQVYLAAKDGSQAREIAGTHILAMYDQSPDLIEACKLNKTKNSIEHLATRSRVQPLSSANKRSIQSKEGLNGSILIDETHVVDQEFVDTVSRMGISRAEPLFLTFSTFGNNPDSYGKRQWEYGEENNQTGANLRHLHISFHAPQDLSDRDLMADPIKYGRMANPAWGHTVDPQEFLEDLDQSKSSPQKLSKFRMYRLNIWQRSAVNFIRSSSWDDCKREYDIDLFDGLGGGVGLDLSLVDDLSSAVFGFQPTEEIIERLNIPDLPFATDYELDEEDEELGGIDRIVLWPVTWITEVKLEAMASIKPELTQWAAMGHLRVLAGEIINRDVLKQEIAELIVATGVSKLCADRTFAYELLAYLESTTGIQAIDFPQQYGHYAKPVSDFERMVIAGTCIHPGNPVYDWQVLNCSVKEVAGKRKPIKIKPNAKIDAAQAGIMCVKATELAGIERPGETDSADFMIMGF